MKRWVPGLAAGARRPRGPSGATHWRHPFQDTSPLPWALGLLPLEGGGEGEVAWRGQGIEASKGQRLMNFTICGNAHDPSLCPCVRSWPLGHASPLEGMAFLGHVPRDGPGKWLCFSKVNPSPRH